MDFRQFLVVLKEEAQVLVGDVNVRVATVLAVKFDCLASSRKGIFVDLVLDLIWGVGHVNGSGFHTRAHLGVVALKKSSG